MGSKFDLRVTVNANGNERVLFSVKDPPNGELLISRKKPDVLRPHGLNLGAIPLIQGILPRVKEQRYSIHPSKDSADSNLLKATTTIESGQKIERYHLTKAIKGGERYAPLFIQRCPRLDGESFSKGKAGIYEISLGSYDPTHFTLCFGVFVTARETEFPSTAQPAVDPLNIVQHQFRNVRMIVTWNFLALPSHTSSMASLFQTTAETPERTEGLTAEECCNHFMWECWTMEEELRKHTYLDVIKNNPHEPFTVPIRRYFADGMIFTPEAAQYIKELSTRTVSL